MIAAGAIFAFSFGGNSKDNAPAVVVAKSGSNAQPNPDVNPGLTPGAMQTQITVEMVEPEPAKQKIALADGVPPLGRQDNASAEKSGKALTPSAEKTGKALEIQNAARVERQKNAAAENAAQKSERAAKRREARKQLVEAVEQKEPVVEKRAHAKTADEKLAELLSSAEDEKLAPSGKAGKPRKTAPAKAPLDRGDVSSALASARKKSAGCGKKHDANGTVMVKFTVDPSGKVSKADGKGELGKSDAGQCVVKAVRRARFPAFDGRPTSFTYPFVLTH